MINLLIDTTSWKRLISKTEVSKSLHQVSKWVKGNEVTLLCPAILQDEWQRHREVELKAAKTSVAKAEKEVKLLGYMPGESQLQFALDLLQSQISVVDELFQMSVPIETPDSVLRNSAERQLQHRPPFHNKKDSLKDCILILTVIEYLRGEGHKELFFLSDNYNDFAVQNDNDYQLNPDILSNYPDLSVKYFRTSTELIEHLIKERQLSSLRTDIDKVQSSSSGGITINMDSSVVDQLHEYVMKRFKDITIYPIKLLLQDFPFRIDESHWAHYNIFTLYTNNTVLFNFFNSLELKEDGVVFSDSVYLKNVDDAKVKTETVIKQLNSNLIFSIGSQKKHDKKEIRLFDKSTCDCVRCQFNRLNFSFVLNNLNPIDGDSKDELFKRAYINYQCGNFLKAVEIFEKLGEWAKISGNQTSLFIIYFNLNKLSIFIENHYWGEDNRQNLVERLRATNLEDFAKKTSTLENQKLIEFIVKGEFYSSTTTKMYALGKEIRDSYYHQTAGGFSSNSTIWNVINEFASLDAFLNQNFIVYDAFKEFDDLFEIFTESIIASHSIPESQGSKLNHVNDYILTRLIRYGEPDTILKLVRRYNLKEFTYKAATDGPESFLSVCLNVLSNYSLTLAHYTTYSETQHNFFWTKFNRILCNILIISKLVNFDSQTKNLLVSSLLDVLKIEESLRENNLYHVKSFLRKLCSEISHELKQDFIDLIISKEKYHTEDFLHLASELSVSNNRHGIKGDTFTKIIKLHFIQSEAASRNRSSIVYFFESANSEQRTDIKNRVEVSLQNKFDYDLFYKSVMYNIIESSDGQFAEFFKESLPKPNSTSFRNAFINRDEKRFERVNMLINLCFKIQADFGRQIFTQIKEIDLYYRWLLDLENFDYSKFKVYWIIEYDTKYFNERFRNCIQLRDVLTEYLKTNKAPRIQEAYFGIYGGL